MGRNWRPYIAAFLAFLYPGLGHVYLRSWFRAAAWFGIALVSAVMVVPDETLMAMGSGDLNAAIDAGQTLPLEAAAALLFVRALNVVDAYLVASRPRLLGITPEEADDDSGEDGDGPGDCPSCGKDLDAELDFCPWCTQRLEVGPDENPGADGAEDRPAASR